MKDVQNPTYSVVIPARNEERSIVQMLESLGRGFAGDSRQVLVICNGSTDRTAEYARSVDPKIEVVEVPEPGKWRAINEGLARLTTGTALIVDADVIISGGALDALALELQKPDVEAVSPGVSFDLLQGSAAVRAYYRVFAKHSYLTDGTGGAGVYGLSQVGIGRVAPLPPIVSDDGFIRSRVPIERQRRLSADAIGEPVLAIVRPPRTVGALIRCEMRWRRGDSQLQSLVACLPSNARADRFCQLPWRKCNFLDILTYVAIKAAARIAMLFERKSVRSDWRPDRGR